MSQKLTKLEAARGRGRPRKEKELRRGSAKIASQNAPREEILKAAANLFSLKGYAGTTIAEIADAVGIRSPSMYYHFSDKAEILKTLANICLDQSLTDTKKLLKDGSVSIPERLYRLVHEQVHRLCQSPYELNCIFDPAFHDSDFADIAKRLQVWIDDLEHLIRIGVEEGYFPVQNASVAAYTVRSMIESAIRQRGGMRQVSHQEAANYVAIFALNGLSGKRKFVKVPYKGS